MKEIHIMTEEKEINLTPNELTSIALTCPNCKAEQCVDLTCDSQTQRFQKAERFLKCGVCSNSYEPTILQALQALLEFHSLVKKSQTEFIFRIWLKKENKQ